MPSGLSDGGKIRRFGGRARECSSPRARRSPLPSASRSSSPLTQRAPRRSRRRRSRPPLGAVASLSCRRGPGLGPYAPATPPEDGFLDLSVRAEDRARLEGRSGPRRGPLPQISVVMRGDQLVAQPTGRPQLTLLHQGGLRFRADLDADIGLHFDGAGQLVVEQGGRNSPCRRWARPTRPWWCGSRARRPRPRAAQRPEEAGGYSRSALTP